MIELDNTNREFHLYNEHISYIIRIFDNGRPYHLYFGKRIDSAGSFSHLLQQGNIPKALFQTEQSKDPSQHYSKMEYPCFGTGDFRDPAIEIEQLNGSRITEFVYDSCRICKGKKKPAGLPGLTVNEEQEAETLELHLKDELIQAELILKYTIFKDYPVIVRSNELINHGKQRIRIHRMYSTSLDLPDSQYEMMQLSGAWARERQVVCRPIAPGIQSVESSFGISSAEHNPFLILKRPWTTEDQGEALSFSLIYSGNHKEQVEVTVHGLTRVMQGINPLTFSWPLDQDESFQTPESVITYTDAGLNDLSQTLHSLYNHNLVTGSWKNRERPVLINNWEATEMNFDEQKILDIASKAARLGIELFVLDDGWFGERDDDTQGLGDWFVSNFNKLPSGIAGLSEKIEALGMKFGLWIEPEMVNFNSDLYRAHPDWVLKTPGRSMSQSRHQYVLDYSNPEVVDHIYDLLVKVLDDGHISYIKWDMNRFLTECYSPVQQDQGTVYHRYVLGVYSLYERLISRYPDILFESCSSGGLRFDPGMLYYAPQCWTSDDTDAIERLKIQYGTSYAYPVSSMGAHVSQVPNQQTGRTTTLATRAHVAMFGAFGYELDLNELSEQEQNEVALQVAMMKKHRRLFQYGTFYRLQDPFTTETCAWMMVSENRSEALVGYYHLTGHPNQGFERVHLRGLDEKRIYSINEDSQDLHYGNELMYAGMMLKHTGAREGNLDFSSQLYYLKAYEKR